MDEKEKALLARIITIFCKLNLYEMNRAVGIAEGMVIEKDIDYVNGERKHCERDRVIQDV